MQTTGLSSSQFADNAFIPRPTLSQIITGRNKKISNEIFSKLHDAFPSLNMMWLMFGDGDMLSSPLPPSFNAVPTETPAEPTISARFNAAPGSQCQLEFENTTSAAEAAADAPKRVAIESFIPNNHQAFANRGHSQATSQNQLDSKSDAPSTASKPATAVSDKNVINMAQDTSKRISSIMVFYSDNSFEIFKPSE